MISKLAVDLKQRIKNKMKEEFLHDMKKGRELDLDELMRLNTEFKKVYRAHTLKKDSQVDKFASRSKVNADINLKMSN